MGERLGKPLTEEVGKPRVLPNSVPLPMPEKVAPGKKEERVKVLPDGTEAIAKAAAFLGISEAQVREMMDGIVFRIREIYLKVEGLGKAQHVYEAPKGSC